MAGPDGLEEKDRGGWIRENKCLGSGGFGTVALWHHKETGQKIAVKRCRMVSEMTAKHKERWTMEVDIMKRLSHLNVVAGLEIPEVLLEADDKLPPMAMEYCSGGDLRKTLNKPQYCAGLPEFLVRSILQDVGSGMEYLHSHRIIHRDLKPENIVLQNTGSDEGKLGRKIVCKITDLGYAKDLDQGSICTSFVGTPQYLAPELLDAQPKYTCTVDYWSFGVLAFEIIAGARPFLSGMTSKNPFICAAYRHEHTRKKANDVIHIFYDEKGEIKDSNQLPAPNHLCRTSQQDIQQWLRLMLMWDPRARGGRRNEQKRPMCFSMLEDFLNVKIVFVFCMYTHCLLSFKVKDDDTVNDLQLRLQAESKMPIAEQELLLSTGLCPDANKPAKQCASEMLAEEEWVVFLLLRSNTEFPLKWVKRCLPDSVQAMFKDPKAMLTYPDQKRIWAHSVYFCWELAREFKFLIQGQRAAMMALLRSNKILGNLKAKVSDEMTKLAAQADFFKQSLTSDLAKYREQQSGGISSKKLETSWEKMAENVDNITSLKHPVRAIDEESVALYTKITELQRSPFAKTKPAAKLDEIYAKAEALYGELKQKSKESKRGLTMENKRMVSCILSATAEREIRVKELYSHLSKIQMCRIEIDRLLPRLNQQLEQVRDAQQQLKIMQEKRQADVWSLLKCAIKQNENDKAKLSPLSVSPYSSSGPQSTTEILEEARKESLRIMNDNESTKTRLEEMMGSLIAEVPESQPSVRDVDWEFLSEDVQSLRLKTS